MIRTYDAMYADLVSAGEVALQRDYDHAAFSDRLADIWNEIAHAAAGDQSLPAFARLAPALLRDRYRQQAHESRERREA